MPSQLPPPPSISLTTIPMAGILVDVYGLAELPAHATRISILWLHHGRFGAKADMADVAARAVAAWNDPAYGQEDGEQERRRGTGERGLLALAYEQRNHGSRLVDANSNGAWREGNERHAVDMFAALQGMVADQTVLLDLVEAYLFPDAGGKRTVDQHLALGVSLGGHDVWQLMFAEPRVTAGVVIIGCPDYINLLTDRARLTKRSTFSAEDNGASFLGSKDFPRALIEACKKFDPKAIFFGTSPVPEAQASVQSDEHVRNILRTRLRGKKFLLCSGGDDKLVPYRVSEPFLKWFKTVTTFWFRDQNISVDDRTYPGVGHEFSAGMVVDSVKFVVDEVAKAGQGIVAGGSDEPRGSKI